MLFFWAFFTRSMKSDLSYWLLIVPFYIDHAGMMTSREGPGNLWFKYWVCPSMGYTLIRLSQKQSWNLFWKWGWMFKTKQRRSLSEMSTSSPASSSKSMKVMFFEEQVIWEKQVLHWNCTNKCGNAAVSEWTGICRKGLWSLWPPHGL